MSKVPTSDPRIAPKEMIITRTKSAQQKRTLRDKDRSMLSITQLVKPRRRKSNDKTAKRKKQISSSPKKLNNSCEKNTIVVSDDESKEYYPDKLRRKFEEKKVFLKPHYESKLVVKLNKRKLKTPHRGGFLEGTPPESLPADWSIQNVKQRPSFTDLTMEEMVRIVEETDSLDDEDLMEILTCPSPVWWEDPPGEKYLEDPIYKRAPDEAHSDTKKPQNGKNKDISNSTEANTPKTVPEVTDLVQIAKKEDQFQKKRIKLENVLGNIKNSKTVSDTNLNNNINTNKDAGATKEINEHMRNENKKLNNDTNTNKDLGTTKDVEINEDELNENRNQKTDSDSATSFTDLDFNEDLLRDLENMDIPVESSCKTTNEDNIELIPISKDNEKSGKTYVCIKIPNKTNEINKNKTNEVNRKPKTTNEINIKFKIKDVTDTSHDTNRYVTENTSCIDDCKETDSNRNLEIENTKSKDESSKEDSRNNMETVRTSSKNDTLSKTVPLNMPRLTKRPKLDLDSSPTIKIISDEVQSSSSENIDTISDTNIRFIIDEELETNDQKLKDVSAKDIRQESLKDEHVANKTNFSKEVLNALKDKKEFITVYKIVSNDTKQNKYKNIPEYSNYVENLKRIDDCTNEESKCSGQLNSFFKKCKNANRKKRKEIETRETEANDSKETSFCDTCEPKKSITVAQDENVKYCLNCSSIFDTEECSYCLNSNSDGKFISQSEFEEFEQSFKRNHEFRNC